MQLFRDVASNLLLQRNDLCTPAAVVLAPDFGVVPNIGNLGTHFDVVSVRHDSSAYQRGDTQSIANLLQIYILSFELEGGAARFHLELRCMCETVGQRLGDAIAEILCIGISASIDERQHGNGIDLRAPARSQVPSANCSKSDGGDASG